MRRALSGIVAAAALLLGTIGPAAAVTYRWIDEDGVVNYSNDLVRYERHHRRVNPGWTGAIPEPRPESSASRTPVEISRPRESRPTESMLIEVAAPRRTEDVTTEVMRLSGLDFQVGLLAMMVQGEFERWRRLGIRPVGGAARIVAQTFSADTLRSNMHEFLARSLDKERTRILLAWLRTPLSQRIVSLEIASSTAERQRELVAFINRLPSTPPAPARLTLIHRLERAGDATQGSATVMAAAAVALQRTAKPSVTPVVMAERDADGPQGSPVIDESYRLRTMMSLLFTYHDLSDAELGRYVAVLESPTGRWFTQISHSAFLASLEPPDQPKRAGTITAATKRAR